MKYFKVYIYIYIKILYKYFYDVSNSYIRYFFKAVFCNILTEYLEISVFMNKLININEMFLMKDFKYFVKYYKNIMEKDLYVGKLRGCKQCTASY